MKIKIAVIAMVAMCVGVKAQTEYPIKQETNKINNSPWYGLGQSNIILPSTTSSAVQLAGYHGVVLKTGTGSFTFDYNGNLGIGTDNPSQKFEIGGDSKLNLKIGRWASIGTTGGGLATVIGNNVKVSQSINNRMEFITSTNDGAKAIKMQYNEGITFHTMLGSVTSNSQFSGYERMRIDNNGNVGIGTTSPDKQLTVNSQIKILKSGNARTQGDKAELIFGEINSDSYSGSIRLENTNSNPGYVNPKMVFSLQDINSSTLDKVKDRMTILPNGNVGIGITNPQTPLDVKGIIKTSDNNGNVLFTSSDTNGSYMRAFGNQNINFRNTGGSSMVNFNLTDGSATFKGKVGIGTTDTKGFELGVDGRIAATEVKVASYGNWPDFVFEKNYNLSTLTEVEKHIKEKGHLKDIPSAKDVEKNGFFLGEMDAKLLQKIEELTLYTLEQEKRLKEQDKKFEKQEKELKELKILVKRLLEK